MTQSLGLHETLEVHELLTFKNICLTKASTMSALTKDEELQAILSVDASRGKQHIQKLQDFLTNRGELS